MSVVPTHLAPATSLSTLVIKRCGVILHCTKTGRFLMVRQRTTSYWGWSKGHKLETETMLECAIRELFEETRIKLTKSNFAEAKMLLANSMRPMRPISLNTSNSPNSTSSNTLKTIDWAMMYYIQVPTEFSVKGISNSEISNCEWKTLAEVYALTMAAKKVSMLTKHVNSLLFDLIGNNLAGNNLISKTKNHQLLMSNKLPNKNIQSLYEPQKPKTKKRGRHRRGHQNKQSVVVQQIAA